MSGDEHIELAAVMGDSTTTHPEVELVYAPLGHVRAEPPYGEIDPGVRETVRWLFENGFHPTDSGDGVSRKDTAVLRFPHVAMVVDPPESLAEETDRLNALLNARGVRIYSGIRTAETAAKYGVPWDGVPEGVVCGLLEGNYAPGGPAVIVLEGVNDVILGLREGA